MQTEPSEIGRNANQPHIAALAPRTGDAVPLSRDSQRRTDAVLSRQWDRGRPWQDGDEETASQDSLYRLTQGLLRRCRKKIYLGFSDVGPHGWEERGPLMRAVQKVLLGWSNAPEVRA